MVRLSGMVMLQHLCVADSSVYQLQNVLPSEVRLLC